MERMTFFEAFLLGIVEGFTEFLPVSSTGHLIAASALLGIEQTEFLKSFTIIIQLGAICAVVFLYGKRLLASRALCERVALAFVPTAIVGLLAYPYIKLYLLGNTSVVALSLFVGALAMLWFERWYAPERATISKHEDLTRKQALAIGLAQTIALIPGVSRSASTSIGGMVIGLDRKATVEFSFMLAIPTIFAASGYDLLKNWRLIADADGYSLLVVGFLASFVSAYVAVHFLLRHMQRRTFREFAWYRIFAAVVILLIFGI